MIIHEYKVARKHESLQIDKSSSQSLARQQAKNFLNQLMRRHDNQLFEHDESKLDYTSIIEEIDFNGKIDRQLNKKLLKCDQDGKVVWEVVSGTLEGLIIECARKENLFYVTLIAPCLSMFHYINNHKHQIKQNLFSIGEISKLDIQYVDRSPF